MSLRKCSPQVCNTKFLNKLHILIYRLGAIIFDWLALLVLKAPLENIIINYEPHNSAKLFSIH
jgi:hypothetical protein